MCGGTVVRAGVIVCVRGLSPRVRGNQVFGRFADDVDGSIPACAGEPPSVDCGHELMSVYPRVCGGTPHFCRGRQISQGLSPRVRGNPKGLDADGVGVGSIPACAGEPVVASLTRVPVRVYPRVCGGTSDAERIRAAAAGLSPRVRGNRTDGTRLTISERSIPACAGEPAGALRKNRNRKVYPRVCGGTGLMGRASRLAKGLSPRVRGNPFFASRNEIIRRSIPACAGEPLLDPVGRPDDRVYPRVCGGTLTRGRLSAKREGLSPRVRGNQPSSR